MRRVEKREGETKTEGKMERVGRDKDMERGTVINLPQPLGLSSIFQESGKHFILSQQRAPEQLPPRTKKREAKTSLKEGINPRK